jgi:hypothetical protein
MNTYKITNITNQLHKRDINFKTPVKIEYIDDRKKKVTEVKTGENLFLTVATLPLSIHRLRIKGLINISEASVADLKKINPPEKKTVKKTKTEKPKSLTTKSSNTESDTDEVKKSSRSKSSTTGKKSYSKSSSSKSTSTSSKTDSDEKESSN